MVEIPKMASQQEELPSTVLFCRSNDDGSVTPNWDESCEAELQGQFEVGLTIAQRFLLTKKLGHGSMGRVFLAKDLRLDRAVAVKVVLHRSRGSSDLEAMLQREAKLGANLNHQYIAAVYDFGVHDNKSYTIFEYVEGQTLRDLLQTRRRLLLDETLKIVSQLASALDFAHAHGVIHRDLKPQNIAFTASGDCKILDLGIALDIRHDVEAAGYFGTPAYCVARAGGMPPDRRPIGSVRVGTDRLRNADGTHGVSGQRPRRVCCADTSRTAAKSSGVSSRTAGARRTSDSAGVEQRPRRPVCQVAGNLPNRWATDPVGRTGHIVPTSVEDRIGFYVAHVAEDSMRARQIAEGLERRQYACWFYGRNAIPGVSLRGSAEPPSDGRRPSCFLSLARRCVRRISRGISNMLINSAVRSCPC
jgi:hypothetical protein